MKMFLMYNFYLKGGFFLNLVNELRVFVRLFFLPWPRAGALAGVIADWPPAGVNFSCRPPVVAIRSPQPMFVFTI